MMPVNIINNIFDFFDSIEITNQTIQLPDSKKSLKGIKIAHISDLHINKWNMPLLEASIEKINTTKPDIVVISGDIICNGKKFLPELFSFFKKIKSKYGIYACLGNHDHSDGNDGKDVLNAYNNSDIRVLNNESEKIIIEDSSIYITGIDDYKLGQQDLKKATKHIPEEENFLLLAHNPINFEELAMKNPLAVFAGHTHGGQLYLDCIKQIYKKLLKHKYIRGKYEYNNSMLYVNRGIGTSMFSDVAFDKKFYLNTPRFNSKPEIAVFEFV